jgi:hypothetical protein
MLDTLRFEYDLKLGTSQLGERPLWVVIGNLKPARREQVRAAWGRDSWPQLYPTRVHVAIAKTDDPETGFGKGLPVRIEHFSDPIATAPAASRQEASGEGTVKRRRMISLLEFYSIRPVSPPPIERFRFENQDAAIDFVNETDRYENRFGIRVSAAERAKYR